MAIQTEHVEIIPDERDPMKTLIAFKVSEAERAKLEIWREWLYKTVDPQTGQPFIESEAWSSMMQFALNVAYAYTRELARRMTMEEEAR